VNFNPDNKDTRGAASSRDIRNISLESEALNMDNLRQKLASKH